MTEVLKTISKPPEPEKATYVPKKEYINSAIDILLKQGKLTFTHGLNDGVTRLKIKSFQYDAVYPYLIQQIANERGISVKVERTYYSSEIAKASQPKETILTLLNHTIN